MRVRLIAAVGVCCLVSATGVSASPRDRVTVYRDCLVQEMRSALPAALVRQSIPEDWNMVPYPDIGTGLVATGGMTLSCTYRGQEIRETLWWNEVVPPPALRDRHIDSYAFLLVASSSAPEHVVGSARGCFESWLSPADISIEGVSDDPRAVHTITRSERWGTDESYVEAHERAGLRVSSWRVFSSMASGPGYDPAYPITSFDVRFDAEDALAGTAVYGQNVSNPTVDPGRLSFGVPGYFQGVSLLFETKATISDTGPTACRKT